MRGRLLAAALSSMMILLLLAPNVLMAQSEVQTMHSIAVKGDSFDIKPLKPIVSCSLDRCHHNVTVIKKERDHQILSVRYEREGRVSEALVDIRGDLMRKAEMRIYLNGSEYRVDVERTLLVSFPRIPRDIMSSEATAPEKPPISRSLNISLVRFSGNFSAEYYQIDYSFRSPEGNLSVSTILLPSKDAYVSAFTTVRYTPVNKKVTSLELVNLSGVTLSQMYRTLGNLAENLSNMYEKGNETVKKQLPHTYSVMARELRHLANIIGSIGWIKWINKPIMNAKAIMSDDSEEIHICYALCGWTMLWICEALATCGGVPALLCGAVSIFYCWYVCSS
jgi:hypothetical protein